MQSDCKELYRITSETTGKTQKEYKDIGSFVFDKARDMIRKPKSLITNLKGIGSWYLRKQRVKVMVENYPPDIKIDPNTIEDLRERKSLMRKQEVHKLFVERLKDYEVYTRLRQEIRVERNKTQQLLIPKDDD